MEQNTQKTALIIGARSDIGAAVARKLVAEGYRVIGTYFRTTESNLVEGVEPVQCDLRDRSVMVHLLLNALEETNADLVVTAAFPFLESDNCDFDMYREVESILQGHVFLLTQLRPSLNPGAKIINMLGQCVERGLPGAAFYSAAFAFLHNWGNSVNAKEGKEGTVSVCDLLLGPVDTREWSDVSDAVRARYEAKVASFLSPEEVAEYVAFLAQRRVMPSTIKLDAYYGY